VPEKPKVLAIVPARGGSKGIRLKNLRVVAGQSLLARTLGLASALPEVSQVCVSTDHPDIKAAALQFDGVTVVDRPEELSGDRVADSPVLKHALEATEALLDMRFDVVLMLQVTSPLRDARDIRECLEALANDNGDAAWTVSPTELHFHPLKQLVVDDAGNMDLYDSRGLEIVARQQLTPVFHRNGSCYALRRDFLMSSDTLFSPGRSKAIISEGVRVNIDAEEDLTLAEELLAERATD
jgi:CMP-N,N'-diacetyllegionaminic acid synthase